MWIDQLARDLVAAVDREGVLVRAGDLEVRGREVRVLAGLVADELVGDLERAVLGDDRGVRHEVARVVPQVVELALHAEVQLAVALQEQRVLVVARRGAVRPVAAAAHEDRGVGFARLVARAVHDHELVVHDLVHPAHVDAHRLEAARLGRRERGAGELAIGVRGLEQEAHLHAAKGGGLQRGVDARIGVRVHRDVDRRLRAVDELRDASVVAVGERLGREDDVAAGRCVVREVAVLDRVLDEEIERDLADERHAVELGEIVEEIVVCGAGLAIRTVAMLDDADGRLRVEPHLVVELVDVHREVVHEREHGLRLGRVGIEGAIRLAAAERAVLGVDRVVRRGRAPGQGEGGGPGREEEAMARHGARFFKTWAEVGYPDTCPKRPGFPRG
jgi:hypothetical protein